MFGNDLDQPDDDDDSSQKETEVVKKPKKKQARLSIKVMDPSSPEHSSPKLLSSPSSSNLKRSQPFTVSQNLKKKLRFHIFF